MGIEKERRPILTPRNSESVIPGSGAPDYSTAEADTGRKWTDGSAIYCKVVNIGTLPVNNVTNTAHGISGLGTVLGIGGTVSNGTTQYLLSNSNSSWSTFVTVDATNVNVTVGGAGSGSFSGFAILEYTKV